MRIFLLITLVVLVGLPLIWLGALKSERLMVLRGIAQVVHFPDDFFAASVPLVLRRTNSNQQEVDFAFTPKYAGRYQMLVTPVIKNYGAKMENGSVLACEAHAHKFQVSSSGGRVEFDNALKLGFAGRLITFDTNKEAKVGVRYRCKLSIETSEQLVFRHAYVKKIMDI